MVENFGAIRANYRHAHSISSTKKVLKHPSFSGFVMDILIMCPVQFFNAVADDENMRLL